VVSQNESALPFLCALQLVGSCHRMCTFSVILNNVDRFYVITMASEPRNGLHDIVVGWIISPFSSLNTF